MEPRLKSIYKNQILPELKNSLGVKKYYASTKN